MGFLPNSVVQRTEDAMRRAERTVTLWNVGYKEGTLVTVLGHKYFMPDKGKSFPAYERHVSLMLRKNGRRGEIVKHDPSRAVPREEFKVPEGFKLVPVNEAEAAPLAETVPVHEADLQEEDEVEAVDQEVLEDELIDILAEMEEQEIS
jgi:hypothetical protein